MMPNRRPFYLLIVGAFLLLTIARNAQPGMFLDGVSYASISRNLAAGHGTLWTPFYTSTLHAQFHEHPPLGFALQAVPFALFGDHLAVERVYSVLMGSLIGLLTLLTWRHTAGERDYDWLPLVFWLLPPALSWSIVNNMLEVTQAVFTSFAVLAFVCSLRSERWWWTWAMSSGVAVVAAVLTKGPVGLFPLAAPVVAAVLMPGRRISAARSGGVMLAVVIGLSALLAAREPSRVSLRVYWEQQVSASISGLRGGEGRSASMLRHLVMPILLRMGTLAGIAAATALVFRARRQVALSPWAWFLSAMALAASLPIAVSARIAGHYFVPAIPLYSLACSSLMLPAIKPAFDEWLKRPRVRQSVGAAGVMMMSAAFAIPLLGYSLEPRDVSWMSEYTDLSASMPRATTVGTCEAVRTDWGMHAYMQRFFEVSLDANAQARHAFFVGVSDRPCDVPPACVPEKATRRLALFRCGAPLPSSR